MTHDAGPDEPSETALVVAARGGDGAAFLRLAARYRPQLIAFLAAQLRDPGQVDLDEVAQQTLDAAYDALPRLRDPARCGIWLRAIARRRLLDALAQRARQVPLDTLAVPPTTPFPQITPGLLPAALGPLSVEAATMLALRTQGYSVAEIAARVGKREAAVERALSRARRTPRRGMR